MNIFHPATGTAGPERGQWNRKSPTRAPVCQITLVLFLLVHFQVVIHSSHAVKTTFTFGCASSGTQFSQLVASNADDSGNWKLMVGIISEEQKRCSCCSLAGMMKSRRGGEWRLCFNRKNGLLPTNPEVQSLFAVVKEKSQILKDLLLHPGLLGSGLESSASSAANIFAICCH